MLQVDGQFVIQRRLGGLPSKKVNLVEKKAFLDGTKHYAIISEAASCGISLHADKRTLAHNRRRVHFTMELPWSADKAIQQFGRSHRSNQTSAPIYKIMVTDCGGEKRFASSAAKRLQSLGAILKGDRRALGAGVELKDFDIDNPYGHEALESMYRDIVRGDKGELDVSPPYVQGGEGTFYKTAQQSLLAVGLLQRPLRGGTMLERKNKTAKVSTFLNRLLGLTIEEQGLLYDFFAAHYDAVVAKKKSEGKFDNGIVDTMPAALCARRGTQSSSTRTQQAGQKPR